MRIAWTVALVCAAACSKKSDNNDRGTAPADEWKGAGSAMQPMQMHGGGHGAGDIAPGQQMPAGHPDISQMQGGQASDLPQLPAPDPDRKMDPAHHIKGTIAIDPKLKEKVKAGTPVFLVAKMIDASGQPAGAPLAVERLEWTGGDSLAFSLDESNAMIAGTELKGDVMVVAHYDTDGEARSTTAGDVKGQLKVTIPADGVKVVLDQLIN